MAVNVTKEYPLWIKAYDAKFGGLGKPLEKNDWDLLLEII
jgi:hypothetical protein